MITPCLRLELPPYGTDWMRRQLSKGTGFPKISTLYSPHLGIHIWPSVSWAVCSTSSADNGYVPDKPVYPHLDIYPSLPGTQESAFDAKSKDIELKLPALYPNIELCKAFYLSYINLYFLMYLIDRPVYPYNLNHVYPCVSSSQEIIARHLQYYPLINRCTNSYNIYLVVLLIPPVDNSTRFVPFCSLQVSRSLFGKRTSADVSYLQYL